MKYGERRAKAVYRLANARHKAKDAIAMQAEAIREFASVLYHSDMPEYNSVNHYLIENGYIPEKEEE